MVRPQVRVTSTNVTKGASSVPAKHAVREAASGQKGPKTLKAPFDVLDFRKAYHSSSADRIRVIKAGVSAKKVYEFATALRISQDVMIKRLGLSKSTVSRKAQENDRLTTDQSERLLGMSKLIGLVQSIVEESGDPEIAEGFDAAVWFEEWLSKPNPALGGVAPSTYLDTHEGQEILSTLIAQMQSGAYA